METRERNSSEIERVLPDWRICRAVESKGIFPICLVENPAACPLAMPWGYKSLCGNPDRKTIVAYTEWLGEEPKAR